MPIPPSRRPGIERRSGHGSGRRHPPEYRFRGPRGAHPASRRVPEDERFKQDEIHKITHVHGGAEFLPWHREVVNRCEDQLRVIDPRLSLHYWDWTDDPRSIQNANIGNGLTGSLSLFTPEFMGHGGATSSPSVTPGTPPATTIPRRTRSVPTTPSTQTTTRRTSRKRSADRSMAHLSARTGTMTLSRPRITPT